MNVTITGTGNMARAIGTRLVKGGHTVTITGRDSVEAAELAKELSGAAVKGATAKSVLFDAPLKDEVVVLALQYPATVSIVEQYGNQLAGKIVVDIMNSLNATYDGVGTPPGTSIAEEIAKAAPASAKVVKAFNTTFAGTLLAGQLDGLPLDVFIAGDDEAAKQTIAQLIGDGGLRPIDFGPLARARLLEQLGVLGMTLAFKRGMKFTTGWKLTGYDN